MKRIGIVVMAVVTAMVTAASAQVCEYAGTSLPYPSPGEQAVYQVPDSLEVVYIDHVGRHGARFLSKASYTQDMLKFLDSEGPLTAAGVKRRGCVVCAAQRHEHGYMLACRDMESSQNGDASGERAALQQIGAFFRYGQRVYRIRQVE